MVSDTLFGAIIGGGGVIIGSLFSGLFNWFSTKQQLESQRENLQIRQRAETERRRGEYYLQQKVEALMTLYAVLESTRREYKRTVDTAVHAGISEDEYEEVIDWYHEYEQAIGRAAVFLDEEQHETLLEVLDILHTTNPLLNREIDNPKEGDYDEFGLSEYNDRFDAAEDMLKGEIKEPVEALEKEHTSDM